MGWFSGKPASENVLKADRLRAKADKKFAKGDVEGSILLGVKAIRQERKAERKGWRW